MKHKFFTKWLNIFFSDKSREKIEIVTIYISIIGFFVHLALIALVHADIIVADTHSYLLGSPIAAIYTPFSFVISYEVYLLIYYLPKSTTVYIAKQYEIITLIVIRRVFKDLSHLELIQNNTQIKDQLQLLGDLTATVVLFFLIFIFYKLNHVQEKSNALLNVMPLKLIKFIQIKKIVAVVLMPIFIVLSIHSFGKWIGDNFFSVSLLLDNMNEVNKVFFDDFFTILILVDVLLLLFSFLHTGEFNKIIRNSGFIISTILIKLSFSVNGILNIVLIVVAVLFGIMILFVHNQYEKEQFNQDMV